MPNNMHFLDDGRPDFSQYPSTEKKVAAIEDYLFQLLEALKYALSHLNTGNFQTDQADALTRITKPVTMNITDAEGNTTQITIQPGDITSIVSNLEGDYTAVNQRVSGLTIEITEGSDGITYALTSEGLTISSTKQLAYYSLTGQNPPVGKNSSGVVINANGQPVLSNGWYDEWDDAWIGDLVYYCSSYDNGEHWGAVLIKSGVAGSPGSDGLTVMLNNNPHSFAGTTSAAIAGSTNVGVIAMQDTTRLATTIGTITGLPTGMSASISNNGTNNAYITFSVTTSLTTGDGVVEVPVTVSGTSFTLYWSWSVAFKGAQGNPGSDANVTFNNVNNALAQLFVKISQGTPTTVTDYKIYSPIIEAASIYASAMYAGQGSGYAEMISTGLNVFSASGLQKIGMGYGTVNGTDYPYIVLGAGTGSSGSGSAMLQKLGKGLWVGDDSIVAAGGDYPGAANSVSDISSSYPHATGIFIDFDADLIYKYINGVPTQIGSGGAAVFG